MLNQDTEVQPGWLASLATAMADDPAIGITGCKILYPDGTIQHGGAAITNTAVRARTSAGMSPTMASAILLSTPRR